MSSQDSSGQTNTRQAVQLLQVGEPNQDQRLDNYLLGRLKGAPKTLIYRIIRKGEVRVNGKRAKPDQRLEQGDMVRVPPLRLAEAGNKGVPGEQLQQHLRAAVLFEDDELMVLNKPSGMAVHAGTGMKLGIIESLRAIFPEIPGLELVHRLDRGTSGCLLLAKTGRARKKLTEAFRQQEVHKVYHLLVAGHWPARIKHVMLALQRQAERGGERMVESDPEGKAASTRFHILKQFAVATLLEAKPETGRTHQIRVHATQTGHPLLGDDKYHSAASDKLSRDLGIKRLCLHAAQLEFVHPLTEKRISISAPYDEVFKRILKQVAAKG